MLNKLLMTAIAATMTIVTATAAPAETKKKVVKKPTAEQEANKEIMDEVMLGVAAGLLGGAMKKGKMPKGGKVIVKNVLKSVKKSSKGGDKKDGGGNKLMILFGGE